MADLSLDEIIATKQGLNAKERPLNQNVPKQFQGKPLLQKPFKPGLQQKPVKVGFQQKPFKPGFATKGNRLGGAPLKRAFSAPGPGTKTAKPNTLRGPQTPKEGVLGGPGKGQIDARDMITIKNRIKIGDARMKILQRRMNKGNIGVQPQQPQIPPGPAPAPGPQNHGPGSQQQFAPQQQAGFQPPPQPFRLQGPQRFQQPNQQGIPFQQPRPLMEQQGPPSNQQRPPLQQQRPPFIQPSRPPFNQMPSFVRHQRPPFNQQRPPFNQQQRPPFNQQQRPPFNQQQRPFNQQQPPFNQHPQQFDQQAPEFNQPLTEFDQHSPDFIPEQFGQVSPQFNQEQMAPFDLDQSVQFTPDPQFDQQSGHFNPQGPPEQPQQFGQEGPGQQFHQQAPQFSQSPSQVNQPPPNFMQPPPGPSHPPTFNQPPPDQEFNSPQNLNQPPPEFIQPPLDMSQPPPGFGQLPPDFNAPPPGFQPMGDEDGDYVGIMPANPVEKTVVEDTGISLKITRTIPEVSFDGQNLTVTRRLPATSKNEEAQKSFIDSGLGKNNLNAGRPFIDSGLGTNNLNAGRPFIDSGLGTNNLNAGRPFIDSGLGTNNLNVGRPFVDSGLGTNNLNAGRPFIDSGLGINNFNAGRPFIDSGLGINNFNAGRPVPEPPKKKFQPTPIKAPSPPRNTVKTGGPTLNVNRTRVSSAGQVPVNTRPAIQTQRIKQELESPVPSLPVKTPNTLIRTAKTETASSSGLVTRTLNSAPQQPSRLKPPPQSLTRVTAPSERPSALSRIQLPNQNTGSVFSRMQQQQPQNTRSALARVQHPVQSSSVLSRLSSPSISVTKRLAPLPAAPAQPARMQVSSGTRTALKRPALSLSERFSPGGSGNPIPVITDHSLVKKRRSSEPEPERADVGNDFAVEQGQIQSQEEPGTPLLSPLQGFRVMVSNLHSTVTQDDVIELFGALGPLKRANLLASGQAEVAFIHKEHALLAMKTYHNRELDGQPMFLKLTTPMNAKVMQPPAGEDSPPVSLPSALRTKKAPAPSSAPVEIPLIHKALFKTADGAAPSKAVRFTVKL